MSITQPHHTISGTTAVSRPPIARRGSVKVALAGASAAVVAATLNYGYGTAAAASGGPMRAGDPWQSQAQAITPASFAVGTLVCTFWGTVLALVLHWFARRPARTFARTAVAMVALSLVFPLTAANAAGSTRVTLALAHLFAAAVVVPTITRALGPARASVGSAGAPTGSA